MTFRLPSVITLASIFGLFAIPASAQFNEQTCRPYQHGAPRAQTPTMFCEKKADALAYIDLMERRRTNQISLEEGRKALAEFRETRECVYALTSHISRHTLHQGSEQAPYCQKLGFGATKWPSLIEAELTGDGGTIWVITHALVPAADK